MAIEKDKEGAYSSLQQRLEEELEWPSVYMFKFIYASKDDLKEQVLRLFANDVKVSSRTSSTGKYVSLSIRAFVASSQEVIDIYKSAESISGVMVL